MLPCTKMSKDEYMPEYVGSASGKDGKADEEKKTRKERRREEHGEGLGLGKEKGLSSDVDPPPTLTHPPYNLIPWVSGLS